MPLEEKINKYYAGSRFYDYRNGRFQTPDFNRGNLLNPGTLNLYAYALNNPVNYIDPLGYSWASKKFKKLKRWLQKQRKGTMAFVAGGFGAVQFFELVKKYPEVAVTALVVAAVVATGGTAGPLFVPTLMGAGVGGVSAYMAGGNVLRGMAFGAAVGAIAGGISVYIPPMSTGAALTTRLINIGIGALYGTTYGTAFGATIGYAGGEGDVNAVLKGALYGAAIGAVTGAGLGNLYTSYSAYIGFLFEGPFYAGGGTFLLGTGIEYGLYKYCVDKVEAEEKKKQEQEHKTNESEDTAKNMCKSIPLVKFTF